MRQLFRMPRWRTAHPARQSDRDHQSVSTEESRVPIMLDFASIDLYLNDYTMLHSKLRGILRFS